MAAGWSRAVLLHKGRAAHGRPVRSATSLDVGAAVPLFEAHLLNGPTYGPGFRSQYDVARDGQRFLLNVPLDDADASSITVVLNWTAGLKK